MVLQWWNLSEGAFAALASTLNALFADSHDGCWTYHSRANGRKLHSHITHQNHQDGSKTTHQITEHQITRTDHRPQITDHRALDFPTGPPRAMGNLFIGNLNTILHSSKDHTSHTKYRTDSPWQSMGDRRAASPSSAPRLPAQHNDEIADDVDRLNDTFSEHRSRAFDVATRLLTREGKGGGHACTPRTVRYMLSKIRA